MKAVLFILFIFALGGTARAQMGRDESPDPSGNPRNQQVNNPADELRYRAAVRNDEENHKETVERAEEIGEIGSQIVKAFDTQKNLSREDLKKLERMEKLARKVRGSAGGSDSERILGDPPARLDEALSRLAELSDKLNKCVKKTSRMVVSATVIEHSNEIIQLIKHIRTFSQP